MALWSTAAALMALRRPSFCLNKSGSIPRQVGGKWLDLASVVGNSNRLASSGFACGPAVSRGIAQERKLQQAGCKEASLLWDEERKVLPGTASLDGAAAMVGLDARHATRWWCSAMGSWSARWLHKWRGWRCASLTEDACMRAESR